MAGRTTELRSRMPAIDLYALASHDLRQIPQVLDLMVAGLQHARSDDERVRFQNGIAHATQMLRQMERLLSLTSKWQRGTLSIAPEGLRLGDILGDRVNEISHGRPDTCEMDCSGLEFDVVCADRKVMEVLTEGILLFALKFRKQGPVEIIGCRTEGALELCVAFDGTVPSTALDEMAFVEHRLNEEVKVRLGAGPALARAIANIAQMELRIDRAGGRVAVLLSTPLM